MSAPKVGLVPEGDVRLRGCHGYLNKLATISPTWETVASSIIFCPSTHGALFLALLISSRKNPRESRWGFGDRFWSKTKIHPRNAKNPKSKR